MARGFSSRLVSDSGSLIYEARNPKLVLCVNLEGWNGEGCWGGIKKEGMHVCLWPVHADVWQKPSQYCKAIILHVKKKKKKRLHSERAGEARRLRGLSTSGDGWTEFACRIGSGMWGRLGGEQQDQGECWWSSQVNSP